MGVARLRLGRWGAAQAFGLRAPPLGLQATTPAGRGRSCRDAPGLRTQGIRDQRRQPAPDVRTISKLGPMLVARQPENPRRIDAVAKACADAVPLALIQRPRRNHVPRQLHPRGRAVGVLPSRAPGGSELELDLVLGDRHASTDPQALAHAGGVASWATRSSGDVTGSRQVPRLQTYAVGCSAPARPASRGIRATSSVLASDTTRTLLGR